MGCAVRRTMKPVALLALVTTLSLACTQPVSDGATEEPIASDARDAEELSADAESSDDAATDADASAPRDATPDISGDAGIEAAPADGVKRVLPFSWKGQETYYWCGPGSTRMALSTRLATPPSQTSLAKYMGTTTAGTDHIGLVVSALNTYFPTTRFKTKVMQDPPTASQRAMLKADVLANIGDGFGMVANVISGWRPPSYPAGTIYHYVAIVGYDNGGDLVLIADPAAEGAGGSSWAKVSRTYWISIADLGTWIGGKGYTGR